MSTAALVLVCALDVLGRTAQSLPPIRIIEQRPPQASANAEAFVWRGDGTIHLIATAPAFVAAHRSAAVVPRCRNREAFAVLASIIVHEESHVRHGPEEARAYHAQLTALRSMGYGPGSGPFSRVWQSMVAVIEGRSDAR